jgi:hypothetical protein
MKTTRFSFYFQWRIVISAEKSSSRILAPEKLETTMSMFITEWLHEARSALVHPGARVSGMSDKELRDIGLRPRSLTSTVYREIGKPGLVDFGWRLGR